MAEIIHSLEEFKLNNHILKTSLAAKEDQKPHSNKQITFFYIYKWNIICVFIDFLKKIQKYIVTEQNVYVLQRKTKLLLSFRP